jgi:hypothetical protein
MKYRGVSDTASTDVGGSGDSSDTASAGVGSSGIVVTWSLLEKEVHG